MIRLRSLLCAFMFLCIFQAAETATYYVSPSGTAPWLNCGEYNPCSLATANANADDDDVVILTDGIYGTHLAPTKSGSAGHMITFKAANKHKAVIQDPAPFWTNRCGGISVGVSYIKIDGIKVDADTFTQPGPNHLLLINNNATNVEVTNCYFTGKACVQIYQSTHIWFHNNVVTDLSVFPASCDDPVTGLQLGAPAYCGVPGYNTIENNTFAYGGHHNLETFTLYNVIRNNFFHNEGNGSGPGSCTYGPDSNGLYGNRNIQLYDGANLDGTFNLLEGNRFGPSGPSPDDDGGDGMTVTSPKNIIRYNEFYDAHNNGVYFKCGGGSTSDNNRFYNNTIYKSGRYKNTGPQWQGSNFRQPGGYTWATISSIEGLMGTVTVVLTAKHRFKNGVVLFIEKTQNYNGNHSCLVVDDYTLSYSQPGDIPKETSGTARASWPTVGNVVKNNILFGYYLGGRDWQLYSQQPEYNKYSNNLCTDASPYCSKSGDPLFLSGILQPITIEPSKAIPNLKLDSASPARDDATHLTTVRAEDVGGGINLYVEDALYFQDGSWGSELSRVEADWIVVGSVENKVQISSIDYANNIITLAAGISRADGDKVWLNRKSDGSTVLYGRAPDIGAHEYGFSEESTPNAPNNLSVR